MRKSSLSIITPVFNEEDIIIDCISETIKNANLYFDKVEYIIVNDGSTDKSLEIINTNYALNPDFKIINKENEGFGSAVKLGIENSTNEYIICIPADSPLDKDTCHTFFSSNIDFADIIISYRKERKGYTRSMLLNSKIYHFLISWLFSIKLKDYNWIHLYKRDIFNSIEINSKGLFMLSEVLVKANKLGFKIEEVEVDQKMRLTGIATVSKPSAIINTLKEMISFYIFR